MSNNKESIGSISHESFNEQQLAEHGREHQERLRETRERAVEQSNERGVDDARREVEHATELESKREDKPEKRHAHSPEKRTKISKIEREKSFNNTMKEVRSQMPGPSRTFSNFIHQPVVEKVSDVMSNTVARPNAILAGSVSAFLLTLTVYLVARYFGYALSGAETIASFALGWVVGLIFDYLMLLIRGNK